MKNEIEQLKSYKSPEVENSVEVKNLDLQEVAIKKGKYFASKNLPAPTGDTLANYTNEYKAFCEKLDADINTILQVEVHLANGSMLKKQLEEKQVKLEAEEQTISNAIRSEEFGLNGHNPNVIEKQRRLAIIFLAVLFLSELFFNAKAFQVIGDNLLVGLIMSIGLSFAVVLFAHYSSQLFKEAQTKQRRIGILIGTFIIASLVFIALAWMRSSFAQTNGVTINPWLFYMVNLLLFAVAWLISYFKFPGKEEIKNNQKLVDIANKIKDLKNRLEKIKQEIESIPVELAEKLSLKVAVITYYGIVRKKICKMYNMAIENFKASNLLHRDSPTDCFSQQPPPLNFRSDFDDDEPTKPVLS